MLNNAEIDQLRSLLEVLEAGDIETAVEWLRAAIQRAEMDRDEVKG